MSEGAGPTYLGWHFTAHKTRGRRGWRLRRVERVDPPIVACEHGLHAGTPFVALGNAPGPWVSWVELSGDLDRSRDGQAAGEIRTRLAGPADASQVLREFACDCVERRLARHAAAGQAPPLPSWTVVDVARRFAHGDASGWDLAIARLAAWVAAWRAAVWGASSGDADGWATARAAEGAAAKSSTLAVGRVVMTPGTAYGELAWQEAELDRRLRELVGISHE